ncbi:MAG: tail fiber domain-containing protein [Saprospiraceae bacterium]|nr:tail fiber domain-containing protein [Saprospiraceae bacterium]
MSNVTGKDNFAVGTMALFSTVADSNFALGYFALKNNTLGKSNTAIGYESMLNNITGNENFAIGKSSLYGNVDGHRNMAIGFEALKANLSGNDNIAIGNECLIKNAIGTLNLAIGHSETMKENVDGSGNVALGRFALNKSTSSFQNTAVGFNSLNRLTIGTGNTAIGLGTLLQSTIGENNVAFGEGSLNVNVSGSRNTGFGHKALLNSGGNNNTYLGAGNANSVLKNYSNNTLLGAHTIPYEDNNTLIGYAATTTSGILITNSTAIGAFQEVYTPNTISIGIADYHRIGIGTTQPDTNALIDMVSTTRGFLPPRLSFETIEDLIYADIGSIGYVPNYKSLYFSNVTFPRWRQLNNVFEYLEPKMQSRVPVWNGVEWKWSYPDVLMDSDGDTRLQIEKFPDEDKFRVRIKDKERFVISRGLNNHTTYNILGDNNSFYIGSSAGEMASSVASNNVGIGYNALKNVNALGISNTVLGAETMPGTTSGHENTAIGNSAMSQNTTGSFNTAIGKNSLDINTDGDYNTAIGINSLDALSGQNYNTALGYNAEATGAATTNATAIGNRARVTLSNALVLGKINGINGATAHDRVGIGTAEPSGLLHIKHDANELGAYHLLVEEPTTDFSRIKFRNGATTEEWAMLGRANGITNNARFNFYFQQNRLTLYGNGDVELGGSLNALSDINLKRDIRLVNFNWDNFNSINAYTYHWKDSQRSDKQQLGFIAQNVEKLYPYLVKTDNGIKSLNYIGFVPLLIEGIKSLDDSFEKSEKEIETIKSDINKIRKGISQLTESKK